jgi:hypothetical protein
MLCIIDRLHHELREDIKKLEDESESIRLKVESRKRDFAAVYNSLLELKAKRLDDKSSNDIAVDADEEGVLEEGINHI